MNIKMENKAKFEIVDAILRKLDIAMEYNGSWNFGRLCALRKARKTAKVAIGGLFLK